MVFSALLSFFFLPYHMLWMFCVWLIFAIENDFFCNYKYLQIFVSSLNYIWSLNAISIFLALSFPFISHVINVLCLIVFFFQLQIFSFSLKRAVLGIDTSDKIYNRTLKSFDLYEHNTNTIQLESIYRYVLDLNKCDENERNCR